MVVLAGPRVRCSSTVASTILRRVSRWRSARFFFSYLRLLSAISLNTIPNDIDTWRAGVYGAPYSISTVFVELGEEVVDGRSGEPEGERATGPHSALAW